MLSFIGLKYLNCKIVVVADAVVFVVQYAPLVVATAPDDVYTKQ